MWRWCAVLAALAASAEAQINREFQSYNPARQNSQFQQRGLYQTGQFQQKTQLQQQGQFQRNQYETNQQQRYQYQPSQHLSAGGCREKNERSAVPGSCDRYIECVNGTASEKVCPDGLRFNPDLKFTVYPCQYPIDVACAEGRSALQPADATEDCPHQFGYFRLGDASNCSGFRNCVNGRAYDLLCPDGLAFNSVTYQCDWPDLVPDCDAEAFVGFRCPRVQVSPELGEPAGYSYYKSDADCQQYFVCVSGRPRRLRCGAHAGYDELTGACMPADQVSACPEPLRAAARQAREEEQQRVARKNQLIQTSTPHRQRLRINLS